jgi:hypothetical protein
MTHSIDDVLVRQVRALVSETADAVCIDMEQIPSMELHFYDVLTLHCAEKQRLAAAGFASVATPRIQTGLVYW